MRWLNHLKSEAATLPAPLRKRLGGDSFTDAPALEVKVRTCKDRVDTHTRRVVGYDVYFVFRRPDGAVVNGHEYVDDHWYDPSERLYVRYAGPRRWILVRHREVDPGTVVPFPASADERLAVPLADAQRAALEEMHPVLRLLLRPCVPQAGRPRSEKDPAERRGR
jgi:hypothetical protein